MFIFAFAKSSRHSLKTAEANPCITGLSESRRVTHVISNLLLNLPPQNRPDLSLLAAFETDPSPGIVYAQLTVRDER
jgi:hypothetical protein